VTVGVISDSFDLDNQLQQKIYWGELPANITVLAEAKNCSICRDEGRMMMEVIYDTAPQAKLIFHTAFGGTLAHAQAINNLARNGAEVSSIFSILFLSNFLLNSFPFQIIVDDISYLSEPWFQPGLVYEAVDSLDAPVVYVISAGNFGRQSLQQRFRVIEVSTCSETIANTLTATFQPSGNTLTYLKGGEPVTAPTHLVRKKKNSVV